MPGDSVAFANVAYHLSKTTAVAVLTHSARTEVTFPTLYFVSASSSTSSTVCWNNVGVLTALAFVHDLRFFFGIPMSFINW